MNSIATLGMFNDIRGGTISAGGGAILKVEETKPSIRVNSLKVKNKTEQKLNDFIKIRYVE